ncbi:hypothetical protein ACFSOZ_24825 [Mesorhizobium newzealandense]|uniref:Uncharacterized protein n=1 Tax=Mesorhizobium newzealandense TaxID=1300302 RepID=A0ABW4UHE9_9HYPH
MTDQASSNEFPATALMLEEALRNFVPSELWQAYEQAAKARRDLPRRSVWHSAYLNEPRSVAGNRTAAQIKTAEAAMKRAWQQIMGEFRAQLLAGKLTAYAREIFPFGSVKAIPPDAWNSLRITKIRSGRVRGPGVELTGLCVSLGPQSSPTEERPEAESSPAEDGDQACETMFTANKDYSVVRIGKAEFHLGPMAAAVIRELHSASLTAEPWCSGKELLYKARSKSNNVGDLFRRHIHPSWRLLIEYRHHGKYRLAVAPK